MSLKLITAATALAVSLAEAKAHLRVTHDSEDLLIEAMITAATETAEQITGRAIMPQTWELSLDKFPDVFELTRIPAASIFDVRYVDDQGLEITMASDLYQLVNGDDYGYAKLFPAFGLSWPSVANATVLDWVDYWANPPVPRGQPGSVRVRYVAGYAGATAVPESIKAWIKLTVGSMYENREAEANSGRAVSTTVRMSFVDVLLDRYRVWV